MSERRITKSHPDWKKLDDLSNKIAIAKNPHVHRLNIPKTEQQAIIQTLEDEMEKELEFGRFADFINERW